MRTTSSLMLGTLLAAGCAHAPPPATETTSQSNTASARPAAAPAPVVAAKTPSADEDLDTLMRGQVLHFAFDEARLTPESEQRLQRLAGIMRGHSDLKLTVAGNCDELGTEEYNLELGQKRAATAQAYLTHLGIDASRVATVSYGKERPVSSAHDEQARADNRRDDLTLQRL